MARFCYQIHSHRDPEQVYRLTRAIQLSSSSALVVVSHTHDGEPLDLERLREHGDAMLHLTEGGYADWSHVRRYLEIVELLRDRGIDYDWMINLTGQDYPVRPLREAERELDASDTDGMIEYFDVLSDASPWGRSLGRSRYWFRYRLVRSLSPRARNRLRPIMIVNRLQPLLRLNLTKGLSIGRRVRSPFRDGMRCYGGSAYASVRRECAEWALDFAAERPDVVAHYERSLSPAESYLQTVWFAAGRFSFVNDCKRYFDFAASRGGHPRPLVAADVSPARASGAHFARKWVFGRSDDALELLDGFVHSAD